MPAPYREIRVGARPPTRWSRAELAGFSCVRSALTASAPTGSCAVGAPRDGPPPVHALVSRRAHPAWGGPSSRRLTPRLLLRNVASSIDRRLSPTAPRAVADASGAGIAWEISALACGNPGVETHDGAGDKMMGARASAAWV